MSSQVPVAVFLYKRAEKIGQLLKNLREIRPPRIYLFADGPRSGKTGEENLCLEARQAAESSISWPCQIIKSYADKNLGLKVRLESGLDFLFSNESFAVILEDDCLPQPQFLPFCQIMQGLLSSEKKIAVVSGSCFLPLHAPLSSDFFFTRYAHCWGWATWAARWQDYRRVGWAWPVRGYREFFPKTSQDEQAYWNRIYRGMQSGRFQSWAYGWQAYLWSQQLLTVCPAQNLVVNVGFGSESTHTRDSNVHAGVERAGLLKSFTRRPLVTDADPGLDRSVFENHFLRMAGRRGLWQKMVDRGRALWSR